MHFNWAHIFDKKWEYNTTIYLFTIFEHPSGWTCLNIVHTKFIRCSSDVFVQLRIIKFCWGTWLCWFGRNLFRSFGVWFSLLAGRFSLFWSSTCFQLYSERHLAVLWDKPSVSNLPNTVPNLAWIAFETNSLYTVDSTVLSIFVLECFALRQTSVNCWFFLVLFGKVRDIIIIIMYVCT